MIKKTLLTTATAFALVFTSLSAQKVLDAKENVQEISTKDVKEGWTKGGAIGLDFSWLLLINPRIGSGDSRVGFGGLLNYSANLKDGKLIWNNRFGLQLAVVKVGDEPYTKATDVLQITSQLGRQIGDGKWYLAALGDLQTQFLPTYGKNYLSEKPFADKPKQPLSGKLFAPAILKFAPGVLYKPDANWTILYSPVALKAVIVADDSLAASGQFFPYEKGKTVDFQVGSELRFDYSNKFFNDRLIYTSTLDLYSNYLRTPQNIAVEWYNSLDFVLFKNISLNFKTDWFYDHNLLVYVGGDTNKPGRNLFIRNTFLLKYNHLF